MRESFLELVQLWKAVEGKKVDVGKVVVIDRVDKKVVVLDLAVQSEAGVEGCHDFI